MHADLTMWKATTILRIFCILVCFSSHALAAHSRRRVVTRSTASPVYDRAVTTFDPSGRLWQVEYALWAAQRGATVVAVWHNHKIYIVTPHHESTIMSHKIHRIDHHLWLVTAGLSGDARFLASSLRQYCQQHRNTYGEPPTTKQAADQAALWQHQLTRTGGARVLGCTALVAGIDPDTEELHICSTATLASATDCWYAAVGKEVQEILQILEKEYSAGKDVPELLREIMHSPSFDAPSKQWDVWVLEADSTHRGNLKTACLLNVSPSNSEWMEHL